MTFSPREAGLTLATGAVILFGVSFMLAKPVMRRWKDLRAEQTRVLQEIAVSRQLIGRRAKHAGELEKVSAKIPRYPADKKMDVHWLLAMDQIAQNTGVKINKRQVGPEKKLGPVYELAIECHDWEASQENLAAFLYEAQFESAMLDIRQLHVTAKPDRNVRGRFSLYCAYVKQEKPGPVANGAQRKQP
ncbi:MAG: hypothetical protein QME60_01925 [Verrucomicrobiota bacterium]|nr:hypothetical protein [Verrucomicrobiota bacterium]